MSFITEGHKIYAMASLNDSVVPLPSTFSGSAYEMIRESGVI